ncbi:uncharacterized protein LOC132362539 [Balaenoptera ricei]|uniref:uncharacterized protein LOC132362539 n=1 Tax=Balaenoptera ricei TaxID=2746895 RepID=UPI0028BEBE83|nr:uncharacterized protein LOC132362539 [Balaenoptera ricei]
MNEFCLPTLSAFSSPTFVRSRCVLGCALALGPQNFWASYFLPVWDKESALGPAGQVGGAGSSQFTKLRLTLTSGAGRRQDAGSWGPAAGTQHSRGATLAREPAFLCAFRFRLSAPGQPRRVTDASSFAARGRGGDCRATAERPSSCQTIKHLREVPETKMITGSASSESTNRGSSDCIKSLEDAWWWCSVEDSMLPMQGPRASLVAQWLRICLLMQGTRVRALVWEDPTCCGATRPRSHNY